MYELNEDRDPNRWNGLRPGDVVNVRNPRPASEHPRCVILHLHGNNLNSCRVQNLATGRDWATWCDKCELVIPVENLLAAGPEPAVITTIRENLADLEHEQWKAVPEHARYFVSDQGRVAKLMTPTSNDLGYLRVGFTTARKTVKRFVHAWVLSAFVGPAPPGTECLHADGDPSNNRLSNLRWGTPSENAADKRRHGTLPTGMKNANAVLAVQQVAEARRRYREGETNVSALAREFGCSNVSMRKALLGITRNDADHLEEPVTW